MRLDALREQPPSFDDLLAAYKRHLTQATRRQIEDQWRRDERSALHTPHPFVSLLFGDCLRAGRDIAHGGARYNISSLAEGGTITAANSLYAVKRCVYDEQRASVDEMNRAIAADFIGYARLHAVLRNIPKFGNDDDTIDRFARHRETEPPSDRGTRPSRLSGRAFRDGFGHLDGVEGGASHGGHAGRAVARRSAVGESGTGFRHGAQRSNGRAELRCQIRLA